MPHPARDASPYCRIERIRLGGRELVALAWRGDAAAAWQARWAFMVVGTGTLYQFESPLGAGPPPGAAAAAGVSRLVQLTVSSERGVIVRETFTDWPSYAEAKAAVTRSIREGGTPLVQAFHPPGNMVIQVGGQAPQPAPERPAPVTP